MVSAHTPWCVEGLTPSDIATAFHIEDDAQLGFWDALIVALAVRSGARYLLSEDLNAGRTIAGVTIRNPFVA